MDKAYTLTDPQLMEICVQFAAIMGWIDAPGGAEWYGTLVESGNPEAFHESLSRAMREAVERAANEDNTSVEALSRLRATWEG